MKIWTMTPGMNWDWFALVELHDNGTASVLREGRLHLSDPMQGRDIVGAFHKAAGTNRYDIIEPCVDWDHPRIATGVRVNGVSYDFESPVGRWSFPGLAREPEGVE